MTSTKRGDIARKRSELHRDGVRRRLSPTIEAQRRLKARRRDVDGRRASHVGPRDPRYEYLTYSHD